MQLWTLLLHKLFFFFRLLKLKYNVKTICTYLNLSLLFIKYTELCEVFKDLVHIYGQLKGVHRHNGANKL
jgi:hypothetical protein